ncbi:MAG: hypothetical protein Q8Q33_03955 [Chlamydiota bacterium]|nr:hypothetical protein [Chlamydiota bacterium]
MKQMFNALMQNINKMMGKGANIHPEQFNDALALSTGWTPAKPGGASFCTRKLQQNGAHCVEFVASYSAKIFYFIFLSMGIITGAVVAYRVIIEGIIPAGNNFFGPLLIAIIFTIAGALMFYFGAKPIVFDKGRGLFCKGRVTIETTLSQSTGKNWARLDQIHALQLISEYCSGNKNSYYSYEINLVLKDAQRINVVDHGNLNIIRSDAQQLAQFLNVPVWDAI